MAHKTMIDGTGRTITAGSVMVDGTVRQIKKGRTLMDGTGYDVSFVTVTPISDLSVGASVFMNVNGVRKEWMIVHKGLPGSMYDESCDGVWLLMKDIYTTRVWYDGDMNDYSISKIHGYLNEDFLMLFDAGIQSQIKQVKIPYRDRYGNHTDVTSGAKGLSTKIFLLSEAEVNGDPAYMPVKEGTCLAYFSGTDQDEIAQKRAVDMGEDGGYWWLRTPGYDFDNEELVLFVKAVSSDGNIFSYDFGYDCGVRPALVLPNDAEVDGNFNVIGLE